MFFCCDAVSVGPTLPSSVKQPLRSRQYKDCLALEEGSTVLRSVVNHSSNNVAHIPEYLKLSTG